MKNSKTIISFIFFPMLYIFIGLALQCMINMSTPKLETFSFMEWIFQILWLGICTGAGLLTVIEKEESDKTFNS